MGFWAPTLFKSRKQKFPRTTSLFVGVSIQNCKYREEVCFLPQSQKFPPLLYAFHWSFPWTLLQVIFSRYFHQYQHFKVRFFPWWCTVLQSPAVSWPFVTDNSWLQHFVTRLTQKVWNEGALGTQSLLSIHTLWYRQYSSPVEALR